MNFLLDVNNIDITKPIENATDKLLYGSDMAFFDSRQEIGRIVLSKLTDSQKEKQAQKSGADADCICNYSAYILSAC